MKFNRSILLLVWCAAACLLGLPRGASAEPAPGDLAKRTLGPQTVAILMGATRVETFRVESQGRKPNPDTIDGYPITATGKEQGREFAAQIAKALLDDRGYPAGYPGCAIQPGVAFRIWQDQKAVDVILCFRCQMLYVLPVTADGTLTDSIATSFHALQPQWVALAKQAFPDDPEIRKLEPDRFAGLEPGYPILLAAASQGYNDAIETSLANGDDVNVRDKDGRTALMLAVLAIDRIGAETAKLLIQRGADISIKDNAGKTALTLTADAEFLPTAWPAYNKCVLLLISKGASVDTENQRGETLLQRATRHNNLELVKLLIARGADVNGGKRSLPSALDYARQYHYDAIAQTLKAAGGKSRSERSGPAGQP